MPINSKLNIVCSVLTLPFSLKYCGPNVVAEWKTRLLRIREVLGSDAGPKTDILTEGLRDFPQPLQTNAGI
jgi:hypothetical protein